LPLDYVLMNIHRGAAAAIIVLLSVSTVGLPAQTSQEKKAQYEEVLVQAEKQFNSGNYRNAVERYFFASKLAADRYEFSRVYFGLALSYFYMKDTDQCEKYIKMVLEVDPRRAVSVVFYPITFVQTFDRIRNGLHISAPGPGEAEQVQPQIRPPEVKPAVEANVRTETPTPEVKRPAEPVVVSQPPPAAAVPAVKVVEKKGGHFEVAAYGSSWSVNVIKGLFESSVVDKFSTEIRRVVSNDLRDKYGYYYLIPNPANYESNLAFNSTGPNYGLDIRFYSKGWGGSFSLGLSFEQTRMKLAIQGTVKQYYQDSSYAEATVEGSATANIFSTNLSFRWEILPDSRVSPFFILGFGWAPFSADITETYNGTFYRGGEQRAIDGTTVKSLKDIASENDFDLPDAIVIVHVGLGLKVEIITGLSVSAEAGLWDGFLLRFGAAYRF